ncbi:hypothetical protein FHR53_002458 [Xanthomonas arboricola]
MGNRESGIVRVDDDLVRYAMTCAQTMVMRLPAPRCCRSRITSTRRRINAKKLPDRYEQSGSFGFTTPTVRNAVECMT